VRRKQRRLLAPLPSLPTTHRARRDKHAVELSLLLHTVYMNITFRRLGVSSYVGTPLEVRGLAGQTWGGVRGPPSSSALSGWPAATPPQVSPPEEL